MLRVLLLSLLAMPAIVVAAPRTFKELTDQWVGLLNAGIGIILTLGIVIYFYGVVTSIRKSKEGFTKEGRDQLLWGLLALFVMFSVWGILALLRNTLFGGGGGAGGLGNGGSGGDQAICESLEDCMIK